MGKPREGRTDRATRLIQAAPDVIYRALVDPDAIVVWRPPEGMTATLDAFDAREGGRFRMTLFYADTSGRAYGKSADHADIVEGRFQELVPNARVVEVVTFRSDDPAYAGEMTITTTLSRVAGGTDVAIRCDNVSSGISAEDHQTGLKSTLDNLAAFVEPGPMRKVRPRSADL